jgi:hypothetical protein
MPKIDSWRLCDELSVVAAAFLISGEDPTDDSEVSEFPEDTDQEFKKFESTDPKLFKSLPKVPEPPGNFIAIMAALINAIEGNRLPAKIHYNSKAPSEGQIYINTIDWYKSKIMVADLRKWLKSRGVASGFFFPDSDSGPDYLNPNHPNYSRKLAAAVKAWEAVTHNPEYLQKSWSPKRKLVHWLENNAARFGLKKNDGKIDIWVIENQIAKVANWKPQGGAPKTSGNK